MTAFLTELYALREQISEPVKEFQKRWECKVDVEIRHTYDRNLTPLGQLRVTAAFPDMSTQGTSYTSLGETS